MQRHETGKLQLNERWLDRYAEALKVHRNNLLITPVGLKFVSVKGAFEANKWISSFLRPIEDWYEVAVPNDPEFGDSKLYGGELKGTSMDARYASGTVLILLDLTNSDEQLTPGKRYHIERHNRAGEVEATIKLLKRAPDGSLWLASETTNPTFSAAIPLSGDEHRIDVKGRVVYSVNRE